MKKLLLAFIFLASFTGFSEAQTSRNPCYTTGALTTQGVPNCVSVGTTTPLPVTSTLSDVTVTSPGTSSNMALPVQGVTGGVPIGSPDAGNIAGGSGAGTCAAACNGTTLWTLDTSGYSEVASQTTSAGTATTTFQESNDNVNWLTKVNCYLQTPTVPSLSNPLVSAGTVTATGGYICPVTFRYIRAQFTAYTSGTRTDFWVARKNPTTPVPVVFTGNSAFDTPLGSTALNAPASGTTGAVVSTLAAAAGVTTHICGMNLSFTGTGPIGAITVAGLLGGSQVIQWGETAATTKPVQLDFKPCLPASAVNTAITVTTTAAAGATAVNVNSWGFRL